MLATTAWEIKKKVTLRHVLLMKLEQRRCLQSNGSGKGDNVPRLRLLGSAFTLTADARNRNASGLTSLLNGTRSMYTKASVAMLP